MALTAIIDADAHITEPPDTWTARAPAKYRDRVPRVVDTGGTIGPISFKQSWSLDGTTMGGAPDFEDLHPGSYDSKARLAYMDEAAIWAQVLYPNVGGFGAQNFLKSDDEGLKVACVQTYNDFLQEWCSADPDRLIGIAAMPFWNVPAAVQEVQRAAEMGMRGILFTGEPQRFGQPFLGDQHWDPLWAVAQEAGLPVHFHIGGGEDDMMSQIRGNATAYLYLKNAIQVADLITCGLLDRFPDLKFVSVESGCGWVPFVLESVTGVGSPMPQREGAPPRPKYKRAGTAPDVLFERQVYVTLWFEQVMPHHLLDVIPVDNVLFETDFPHPGGLYGNIQETIERGLGDIPADIRRKFLWENSAKLYNIVDPPDTWAPGSD